MLYCSFEQVENAEGGFSVHFIVKCFLRMQNPHALFSIAGNEGFFYCTRSVSFCSGTQRFFQTGLSHSKFHHNAFFLWFHTMKEPYRFSICFSSKILFQHFLKDRNTRFGKRKQCHAGLQLQAVRPTHNPLCIIGFQ